jgi:ribonuclease VapC
VIVDTSALVAIINDEPERVAFLTAMRDAANLRMSTGNALELSIVLGSEHTPQADRLLSDMGIRMVELTTDHYLHARQAHARYGRGSGSPAKLDFGDCMAYALAKSTGEPLLFKGEHFAHTDIESALS